MKAQKIVFTERDGSLTVGMRKSSNRDKEDVNPKDMCVCFNMSVELSIYFFTLVKNSCKSGSVCVIVCLHSNCHQLLFQFEVCRIWMKLIFLFIIFHWWLSSSVCLHQNSLPSDSSAFVCVRVWNLIRLLQAWPSAVITPFYCLIIKDKFKLIKLFLE